MARLAGAVAMITTYDEHCQLWGLTASSFCSLSLLTQLVLFCLNEDADCSQALLQAYFLALSLLTEQQRGPTERIAHKGRATEQGMTCLQGTLNLPLLPGTLAALRKIIASSPV